MSRFDDSGYYILGVFPMALTAAAITTFLESSYYRFPLAVVVAGSAGFLCMQVFGSMERIDPGTEPVDSDNPISRP